MFYFDVLDRLVWIWIISRLNRYSFSSAYDQVFYCKKITNYTYTRSYYRHLPILTIPWLVISQHDCNLNTFKSGLCLVLKNPNAASVTWYAWRENSHKWGRIWATAPIVSSDIFMQSANFNDTNLGGKLFHRPFSVTSLHPHSSNS